MSQTTTLTFFRYQGLKNKAWAFGMMQFAHRHLSSLPGQSFYKLLGSGKGNGFNPWPDFSIYSLLQVWNSEEEATRFFEENSLMQRYKRNSVEHCSLYMKTMKVDGLWSNHNPFEAERNFESQNSHVAVITRATIKWRLLWKFWRYVPTSEKPLVGNDGLIYTKGIGEVPFLQMATFSLWKDEESLKRFAYQSKEHGKAIMLTRTLNWYKEEMFVRFKPYKAFGRWSGTDLLSVSERLY